eukprot:TRINITY_DN9036_c0_g1_i1.p1 TRINITY_DN9036_c0_g1~~TRINITY_DN9036_c0_g1_i1.p1  ORF type:complete len:523 (-),score=82.47 TRINITY_DN9036_c0_g1_i1:238-1695(-)
MATPPAKAAASPTKATVAPAKATTAPAVKTALAPRPFPSLMSETLVQSRGDPVKDLGSISDGSVAAFEKHPQDISRYRLPNSEYKRGWDQKKHNHHQDLNINLFGTFCRIGYQKKKRMATPPAKAAASPTKATVAPAKATTAPAVKTALAPRPFPSLMSETLVQSRGDPVKDLGSISDGSVAAFEKHPQDISRYRLPNSEYKRGLDQYIQIASGLKKSKTVVDMVFEDTGLTDECVQQVCKGLKINTSLQFLKIGGSKNTTELTGFYVFRALEMNTHLRSLDLENNPIGSSAFNYFCLRTLQVNNVLQEINMKNCEIGYHSGEVLGKVLETNKRIIWLNIASNYFSDGMKFVAKGLENNQYVVSLNISENKLGNAGNEAMANMLKVNKRLMNLNISNCNADSGCLEIYADAFLVNTYLRSFIADKNNFKLPALKKLISNLENQKVIKCLSTRTEGLTTAEITELLEAAKKMLVKNTTIKEWNIGE